MVLAKAVVQETEAFHGYYNCTGNSAYGRWKTVPEAAFLRNCGKYRWEFDRLWYRAKEGQEKLCVVEGEVAEILFQAHDEAGHFAIAITIRKLNAYYWPRMYIDIRDYIEGCLLYAKYRPVYKT